MTDWGGSTGHESVGIDVRTDGYDTNTPSINVYVDFYVRTDAWGFTNDVQTLTSYINGGGWDTFSYTLNSGYAQTVVVYVGTTTIGGQGQSYGGGPTYNFQGVVGGNYTGSNPSHAINWALPAKPPNVPTPPGIYVNNVSSYQALINVTASDGRGAGVDWYGAWVATDPGFTNVVSSAAGGTFWATGLQRASHYYARAQAHNGVGYSDFSSIAQFDTSPTVPDTPGNVTYSSITGTSVVVNFTGAVNGGSAVDAYELQLDNNSDFSSPVYDSVIGGGGFTIGGLTNTTVYYGRVRAHNAVGWGNWSGATAFTTLTVPTAPGTPTFSSILPTGITVNWTSPTNNGGSAITNYQLQYDTNSTFTAPTTVDRGTNLSATLTTLVPGTLYYFRVRAQTAVGSGTWSATASVQTISGAKVLVAGVWKPCRVRVKVNGVWVVAKVHKKSGGAWVI